MNRRRCMGSWLLAGILTAACGGSDGNNDANAGGAAGSSFATGGVSSGGSSQSIGGKSATGGTTSVATGGTSSAVGGMSATGGTTSVVTGGASSANGGVSATGGTSSLGTAGSSSVATCIFYVSKSGIDSNAGASWSNAFANVQPAISAGTAMVSAGTCPSVEVWVAAGIYKPTYQTNPRVMETATFQLAPNVAVYGGFLGTESLRSDREVKNNVTTLSGDIGTENDRTDNCFHVVTGATGATIDGFTITEGYAGDYANTSEYDWTDGGGMYNIGSSPTVANCAFSNNSARYGGGGMYNSSSSPTVTNCTFSNNSIIRVDGSGGGMYNIDSSPTVTNCAFSSNSAYDGAGMYNLVSSPILTNCTFSKNSAAYGGAMLNDSTMYATFLTITNCTFSNNSGTEGGGAMFNNGVSGPTILNSILWGDTSPWGPEIYNNDSGATPSIAHSITSGSVNPLLNSDLGLSAGSPAIDAGGCGDNVLATDILGRPRWDISGVSNGATGKGVDIGAYEYQGATTNGDAIVTGFTCN